MPATSDSYFIGEWLVEPELLLVTKNGFQKKLEPQLMRVLEILVTEKGQVISKDELMERAWEGVIVGENVLTRAISSLRKALEDDPRDPVYIETISKRGYRLRADVKELEIAHQLIQNDSVKKPLLISLLVLFTLAIGAFASRKALKTSSPKAFLPSAIANYSNTEYWPSISPDGKFVAYSWKGKEDDNWDVYVKQIGSGDLARITQDASADLRPKWSPNGSHIYFARYESGKSQLYKRSLLGKEEVRVIEAPDHSFGDFDISPDEKWILYNDRKVQDSPLGIKLISLESGEEKWLTNPEGNYNGDIHPNFSPDGQKIAFIRERNSVSMQLWVLNLKTGSLDQITKVHQSINGFDWSKEGTSLIYGSDRSGLYKLWEVDLTSGISQLLPLLDYQTVMPRIAETGRLIYAKMEDQVNIWSYDMKEKATRIWEASSGLDLNPVFSPTGLQVCFTQKSENRFQIWIAHADGSDPIAISNFSGQYLNSPRWSSDGKFIVFQGFQDGQSDIFQINAKGGPLQNLTNSDNDEHTPFYGSDNSIYFSSEDAGTWSVWKIEAKGTLKQKILENEAYAPQVHAEKSLLFYCKKGAMGLWKYDLINKIEEKIIEDFHPMHYGAFSLGDSGIYYFNPNSKHIEYLDLQTLQSSSVFKPEKRIPRLGISLSINPAEDQLLFTQIDLNDADIMRSESP
ncbi:MAG: winged helix-turn-helix domain-containing protein [Bacteroidia bacterium]|nr:winged helix-turn-helix domain-containing protein [Bacteroidia bacterium]